MVGVAVVLGGSAAPIVRRCALMTVALARNVRLRVCRVVW